MTGMLAAADAAVARGDDDEALRLWAETRSHFPDAVPAWLRAADRMIRLRRFSEAEEVLEAAVARLPDDFWLARTYANLFRHMDDEVEAYTRARALRQAFLDNPVTHADLAQLLLNQKHVAAAEAEAKASLVRFPDSRWLHNVYASCADRAGDDAAAAARWTELLVHHPDHKPAYLPVVRALVALGRVDEAAGISRGGLRLLPNSGAIREACELADKARATPVTPPPASTSALGLLVEALRADASGTEAEAVRLWEALREQAPTFPRAYAGSARALLRLGRMAEAAIVLAKARRDLPADRAVLEVWAAAATERGDLVSALTRLRELRKSYPDASDAVLGIARVLRALHHLDEADAAFAEMAELRPADLVVATEYAAIASERRDGQEAIRRWTRVTTGFPGYVSGYWYLAEELLRAELLADADAVLCDAAARFPDDLETGLRWVMSGRAVDDPARADELRRRFPELAPLVG